MRADYGTRYISIYVPFHSWLEIMTTYSFRSFVCLSSAHVHFTYSICRYLLRAADSQRAHVCRFATTLAIFYSALLETRGRALPSVSFAFNTDNTKAMSAHRNWNNSTNALHKPKSSRFAVRSFGETITCVRTNKHVRRGRYSEDRSINNKFECKTKEGWREYVFTHWRLKPPRHFHCSVIAVTTRLLCTGSGTTGATLLHSPLLSTPRQGIVQIRVHVRNFKNALPYTSRRSKLYIIKEDEHYNRRIGIRIKGRIVSGGKHGCSAG